MKYGLHLAGGASVCDRKVLMDVARIAEEEGCDSLLIGDHIVLPKTIASPWPYEEYNDGKPNYDIYTSMEWLDPFDTIAFVAGITEKVRLGLSVLIVPYRHPFDVARRVATIDVLSGGRFILGTGVGWLEEEFDLLGVPFQRRGKRTREYIEMMKALWTEDSPRYAGEFVQLEEDVNVLPRPLQKPHPPIWVGGESVYALKRVARFGDGWHIALLTFNQIRPMLEQLKRLMDEAGRNYDDLELTAMTDPTRTTPDDIKTYRDLGVKVLYTVPLSRDPAGIAQEVRSFAKQVQDVG